MVESRGYNVNINDITSEYVKVTIESDKRKIEIFRVELDPKQTIIEADVAKMDVFDTGHIAIETLAYRLTLTGPMEMVDGLAFKYTLKDSHIDGEVVQETKELEEGRSN